MEPLSRHYTNLESYLQPNKVLVIYGPRQVGKTTLVQHYLKTTAWKYRFVSGENLRIQEILSSQDFDQLQTFCEGYELIVIDEAQHVTNIGLGLKIIVDHVKPIRVIATGSSSFDLANQVGEPLVGRKRTLHLYPIAQMELLAKYSRFDLAEQLEQHLIFGTYPEVLGLTTLSEKREYLTEFVESYLLKDIFNVENVRYPHLLVNLLKLLAFQVGSEVSLSELATQLSIDIKTVGRYLYLLEQSFILYRLGGLSRNLRKEVSQKSKYYFVDNGIRNAIIGNYHEFNIRNDKGALWENFVVSERIKYQRYTGRYSNNYFWRTYDGTEIDWVEEWDGVMHTHEIKWRQGKARMPKSFSAAYPEHTFDVITRDNYLDFIT